MPIDKANGTVAVGSARVSAALTRAAGLAGGSGARKIFVDARIKSAHDDGEKSEVILSQSHFVSRTGLR